MGYLWDTRVYQETGFEEKIELSGDANKHGSLIIKDLSSEDSAVYFCAAYYTLIQKYVSPAQKANSISVTSSSTPV